MNGISSANLKVLMAIRNWFERYGISPSHAEIQREAGLRSRSAVGFHLSRLVQTGYITRAPNSSRGIKLLKFPVGETDQLTDRPMEIPLKGYVSAGKPVEAALLDEFVPIPADLANRGFFALRVRGDSMIDEHICDGDILVVKPQPIASNNQTVIGLINNCETTVKKFFREPDGAIRLQPANEAYAPIIIKPPDTLALQGVVVRIFRDLE